MKLEIGKFMVKDIVFGDKTAYATRTAFLP